MLTKRFHVAVVVAVALGLTATVFAGPVRPRPSRSQPAASTQDSPQVPVPIPPRPIPPGPIPPVPLPPPGWQEGVLMLGPASFQVRDCLWAQAYLDYEQAKVFRASFRVTKGYTFVSLAAPVHLPLGARITRVTVHYYDTDPDSEPSMGVYRVGSSGELSLVADASGTPGFFNGNNTATYWPSLQAVKGVSAYELLVTLNRSVTDVSLEHALYRVEIAYGFYPWPTR